MAYNNCNTRIVSLLNIELPERATEQEYQDLYERFVRWNELRAQDLVSAVNSIKYGIAPPVAFPTETVYGLGADATNRAATAGIFAAKGRPGDNPLIVHVASIEHLERLTGEPLPQIYRHLVKEHWPGPLTILVPVPKKSPFANNVHPGQKTIGFRVPLSKYARFFIAATGRPIAGPSANSSGKPSPTTAQHVMNDLKGKINFILDGGTCGVGVESTVVDGLCDPPVILRPGGVSREDFIAHGQKHGNAWSRIAIGYKQSYGITSQAGDMETQAAAEIETEAPRAPGMKYKHYAPRGTLLLFEGSSSSQVARDKLSNLISNNSSTFTAPSLKPVKHDIEHANGTAIATNSHPPLNIAVLSTTSWPPFLNIQGTSSVSSVRPLPDIYSMDSTTRATVALNAIRVQYSGRNGNVDVNLFSIHLGDTTAEVARWLFAALRTCDDLGCRFILAESPSATAHTQVDTEAAAVGGGADEIEEKERGSELQRRFDYNNYDAVVERMRKAASEVIDMH